MNEQRTPVSEYLRARRNVLQPEDVGLPRAPGRRVVGLRREEVAALARISPEYYVRLERGHDHQPSAQVLLALAQALRLDDAATTYLLRLNSGWSPSAVEWPTASQKIPESITALLRTLTDVPAVVVDGNQDVLAANPLAQAIPPGTFTPGNNLLLITFSVGARERLGESWQKLSERLVASFRLRSNPNDPRFRALLAELLIQDATFPSIWARHEVRDISLDTSRHRIEPFGPVTLSWQHLRVPETDTYLVLFADPPGSPAAAAIRYLAESSR
ncbi:MAG: hypothetical protein K0R99_430 [Microbacterium sp.]|jgi:transcriptional regulator with XRE-family HTH domain|uniref:MmyB family transcriptional regulator n=1 Tax=Microbacterium sp. TaxID=51671 RepID=UPI002633C300|nr:helix-turn-helix domain-containing protein [Microbacterium sp.]MDF2558984.1 hypothetical protein [Microbacterium sp.]